RQHGQPRRLIIMVEAAGMKPQLEAAVDGYSIPVIASGGFDSLTAKYAQALGGARDTEVMDIGDHEASGVHRFMSLAEDVQTLIHDLGLPGAVQFARLGVTVEQIAELGLPTAPPKATDRRSFQGDTVQAEAIPPDVMAEIVRDALDQRFDKAAL